MSKIREVDIVDVHITSATNVVDCFSQYPLLDGDKRYTCEITEFVCPLAGQDPLPAVTPPMFEIQRKRLTADNVAAGHDDSRLTTLSAPLGGVGGKFNNNNVIFTKNAQRPMQTPGDLAYHLQRFFNDIRSKYIPANPVQLAIARVAHEGAPNDAALLAAYLALGPFYAAHHGGGEDIVVTDQERFVDVQIEPNGFIKLFLSET